MTLVEYQEPTGARIQISKKGESRQARRTGGSPSRAAPLATSRSIPHQPAGHLRAGVRASNPQKVG